MFSKINNLVCVATCVSALSQGVIATPLTEQSLLPALDESQVEQANGLVGNDGELLEQFLTWVHTLKVFPDHEDENKFYFAPYLQADQEAYGVGGQEIAHFAVEVLQEVDELADVLNITTNRLSRLLTTVRVKENAKAELVEELTNALLTDEQLLILQGQINDLTAEITNYENEIAKLEENPITASPILVKEVVDAIRYELARLGFAPSDDQIARLNNLNDLGGVKSAIVEVRDSVASISDFGVRQAVFSNGLTEEQLFFWSVYRQLKPEIVTASLPVNALYVVPAALTSSSAETDSEVEQGFTRILDVNGGSDGACGSVNSCVVSVHYNAFGAHSASLSSTGVARMEVAFQGDATVKLPDFHGLVDCDFSNGWEARGRNDVKDGAIIYDGDVSSRVKFHSKNEGGCDKTIYEGSEEDANYHIINKIYDDYMNLYFERVQKSQKDKDDYEKYVRDELDHHASQSQSGNTRDPWYATISSWVPSWNGFGLRMATAIFGGARDFYWHTRVEDTASIDLVKLKTTIKTANVTGTRRFVFDGNPTVCWVKREGNFLPATLAGCPAIVNDKEEADTITGREEENCPSGFSYDDCLDAVQDAPADPDTDIVQNPFG